MNAPSKPTGWVISDGAAGNERQALALSSALQVSARVLRIDIDAPWRWCAPRLLLGARDAIHDRQRVPIAPPWPSIAIGCGRSAALLVRGLRRWSAGSCFSVQILDPRINPKHFDIVVAPRHDGLRGNNVITTLGALNAVDARWLADGKSRFSAFGALPAPRTTVLVGASHAAQH
ncbi:MAG: ELM1/GtrOC1 family putative glycosyltransferase, partial [Dokdonella sp.]